MARVDTLGNFLTDVADAIRDKTGKTDTMTPSEFDTEIESISTGGSEPEIGITIDEYDSSGYVLKLTTHGFTSIPRGYFYCWYHSNTGINGLYVSGIWKYLNTVKLNEEVTSVAEYSFYCCTFLKEITLTNVKSIGQYAFYNCTSLALTELPSGLTSIAQYTFYRCTSLALTELPSGLTSIGIYAFYNCTSLALTELPSGITSIGNYAFQNCTSLALTELPSGLTSISQSVFSGCTSLALTTLPNITSIGTSTFYNCISLTKISLPSIITLSGSTASNGSFYNCTSLKYVWIGESLTTMPRYVFCSCTALEKIYINLPRETVEAFTYYSYAFMNDTTKTDIIVCNDDEDFITLEEFEALVIEDTTEEATTESESE